MSRVTSHALIRWLTRIRGVNEDAMRRRAGAGAPDCRIAAAGCAILRISVASAEREILPSHLEAAVALGATRIARRGFSLACRDGLVTTVVEGRLEAQRGSKPGNGRNRGALARHERARPFDISEHLPEVEP